MRGKHYLPALRAVIRGTLIVDGRTNTVSKNRLLNASSTSLMVLTLFLRTTCRLKTHSILKVSIDYRIQGAL